MYCSISSNNYSLCTYSHFFNVSNTFPKRFTKINHTHIHVLGMRSYTYKMVPVTMLYVYL